MVKPTTICIYANPSVATAPGTEIKVTPDIAAPIIASVALHHEVFLPPIKKPILSALRPNKYPKSDINNTYTAMVINTKYGDIIMLCINLPQISNFYLTKPINSHKKIAHSRKFSTFAKQDDRKETTVSHNN